MRIVYNPLLLIFIKAMTSSSKHSAVLLKQCWKAVLAKVINPEMKIRLFFFSQVWARFPDEVSTKRWILMHWVSGFFQIPFTKDTDVVGKSYSDSGCTSLGNSTSKYNPWIRYRCTFNTYGQKLLYNFSVDNYIFQFFNCFSCLKMHNTKSKTNNF